MKPNNPRQNHPFRYFSVLLLFAGAGFTLVNVSAWAEDGNAFSGKISAEGGSFQGPGEPLSAYQYSRLLLGSQEDILSGLSYGLEGEADWQSASAPLAPAWPLYSTPNALKLETDNFSSSNRKDVY